MKKVKTPVLFILLTASVLLNFIGCQKQKDVENLQNQKQLNQQTLTTARTSDTLEHDYRIPLDKAARFTKRYRDLIKDKPDEPIVYKVPADALRQLLKRVDDKHVDITHVSFYLAINDEGNRTLVYVPTDKDGKDLIGTPNTLETNGYNFEDYNVNDYGGGCPSGGCIMAPNALNGK